jgi:SHS family lactate transporter-like MFS transporter
MSVASFRGWTLDAFDFFVLVFVLKDIAEADPPNESAKR